MRAIPGHVHGSRIHVHQSICQTEANYEDRKVINEVLDRLSLVQTRSASKIMYTTMRLDSQGEPEDVAKNKIVEMRELVHEMKELIGILKSG